MTRHDVVSPAIRYYTGRLRQFGTTPRGVDWKDDTAQASRFGHLLRALDLTPATPPFSLIDFGCGYGALREFIEAQGLSCTYTGFDLSTEMIETARLRSPGPAVFTSEWNAVPRSDFCVASGVFNVRLGANDQDWLEYVLSTLSDIDSRASRGWAANFLSSRSDPQRRRPDLYYADAAMIRRWCTESLHRSVVLLHDYAPNDFTIGVRSSSDWAGPSR